MSIMAGVPSAQAATASESSASGSSDAVHCIMPSSVPGPDGEEEPDG